MPAPTAPHLAPAQIDDLLDLARSGSTHDLTLELSALAKTLHTTPSSLLAAAQDPETGNGVLHMASANGHLELLKSLLQESPPPSRLVDAPNEAGNTPLHYAAMNGHLDAVRLLVEAGAGAGLRNKAGWTVAEQAERAERDEVAAWLVARQEAGQEGGEEEEEEGKGEGEEENGLEEEVLGIEGEEAGGRMEE